MAGPESGLDESALPGVRLPLRGDKPVAHENTQLVIQPAAFVEGAGVNKYLMSKIRVADELSAPRTETDLDEVRVLGKRGEEFKGTSLQWEQVAEEGQCSGC